VVSSIQAELHPIQKLLAQWLAQGPRDVHERDSASIALDRDDAQDKEHPSNARSTMAEHDAVNTVRKSIKSIKTLLSLPDYSGGRQGIFSSKAD
jgi:hypothetical protein